ncbi:MAG: alpha/beta hydrolase, partial [Bacteroidia bacterium]
MRLVFKFTLVLLVLASTFSSCKKDEAVLVDPKITVEAQTLLDVAYGSHAQQKMDVYLPANRDANTSLVIFVHGGSFISGD